MGRWALLAVLVVFAGVLLASAPASAAMAVWTTASDFESATLSGLDSTSSPGDLLLRPDPTLWGKNPGNPVFSPGSAGAWDQDMIGSLSVLLEGGVYKMWYAGCTGNTCAIGYAASSDGITWTRFPGNPVLVGDPVGWDATIGNPSVLRDEGIYKMWYAGNNFFTIQIGYASSLDGLNWTKYPANPVLQPAGGSWDAGAISTPVVMRDGTSLAMWYSGHSGDYSYRIGRATSADGANWTRDPANPLMSPVEYWEGTRIHPAAVFHGSGEYELYYTASLDYVSIGHAVSPDGVNWTRNPVEPILSPGPFGGWDGASLGASSVVDAGGHRRMWYSGSDGSTRRIGLAVSGGVTPFGVFLSPVIDGGSPGAQWIRLDLDITIPAKTNFTIAAAAGTTPTPDRSWSAPVQANASSLDLRTLPPVRFLQFLLLFLSEDRSSTPVLHEIVLRYTSAGEQSEAALVQTAVGLGSALGGAGVGAFADFVLERRRKRTP